MNALVYRVLFIFMTLSHQMRNTLIRSGNEREERSGRWRKIKIERGSVTYASRRTCKQKSIQWEGKSYAYQAKG